ncbi:cell surface protein SprA [Emticicia sp. CRIBPO]|uniref:T9SS outer membrane translocon Sov/SprA n=1 Tax=Emticicia sp. CRIBPO TaxID=2683258 RepID=UPI001412E730|nr:cell surface protein SprA [Emticicia sp. CRIBPO]NBA88735.1 cell surface protein SprA [Emticicia sp. CRIBPO]
MQKLITQKTFYISKIVFIWAGLLDSEMSIAQTTVPKDSISTKNTHLPKLNWKDNYLSRFNVTYPKTPFFNLYPDSLKTWVIYNPKTENISVNEKLNSEYDFKTPQSLSFNDYSSIQNAAIRQSIIRDYERLQDGNSKVSGRGLSPLLEKNPIIDRLFGGKIPEFKPNGFVSIDLKAGTMFNNNPTTALALRRQPVFDFDQQIAINFNNMFNGAASDQNADGNSVEDPTRENRGLLDKVSQLKEKMGILGNFDTKSAFNFENQFKLNFKNEPEDILQKVELGNISMPVRSQLIPGVQNLFGLKTGLRFGKLDVTTVFAQQRSRTESIVINGGNQSRPFEIRVDNYDENRHFFLSHFFRDKYEKALKTLPMVTSQVRITRLEVYVTNRTNNVTSMRNLAGLSDLGEPKPRNTSLGGKADDPAYNTVNALYKKLADNVGFRSIDNTKNVLTAENIEQQDYEILRGAKRLSDREFEFHQELGYISLLTPLRNDEVLAVSYEYTFNGRSYKVGEMTEDYAARPENEVIMLKLLKSSTIRNRLTHPMWDLMMKNIYSLAQGQISREGFQLRILYKDDNTGIDNPYLQEGVNFVNKPLIEAFGLDRLNYNNDAQKDGNFDYVQGVTINEKAGKIIFPYLEPFGSTLKSLFTPSETALARKYVFDELYSSTMTDAQQVNTKNKFFLSGSVLSGSSEIPLPLGASGQSVRVYAGGVQLQPGTDYIVDSQLGRVKITNQSILNSGRQIRIDYEKPDMFQSQIRRLFGLRMDYTFSEHLRIGGTFMNLRENTPGFLTRVAIGNEPVQNTLWGLDLNYKNESQTLTRLLDKLPLIQTKEPSSIILNAEFAQLLPGVNNKKVSKNAMIDDFEGARNINDLTRQPTRWRLGSTPPKFNTPVAGKPWAYNYKRAKISAYTVDPTVYLGDGALGASGIVPPELTANANSNLYERSFQIQDIFPGRSLQTFGQQLPTSILDISYFPSERGMYNYNPDLDASGNLKKPEENFGAVMRGLTFDADFDNSNIEYLEFWLLDPFADVVRDGTPDGNKRNITGGKLSIQLGDVSEDVIPDNRFNFENGVKKTSTLNSKPDSTAWGYAPKIQFMTDAFDASLDIRKQQDVGLDGLSNFEEKGFNHIKDFLTQIRTKVSAEAYSRIENDPSDDDFNFFLDPKFDASNSLTVRFKNYLGMENNSPPISENDLGSQGSTATADKEDINQDNTINDIEQFHQYDVDLKADPSGTGGLFEVGRGYVVDKVTNGNATWYLHRIPLKNKGDTISFKSVRFVRLVMSEWKQPVVLRFATMQLVSNQYRVYKNDLSSTTPGDSLKPEAYDAKFKLATVNIEENGCGDDADCKLKAGTTGYVVPPGFIRDRDYTQQAIIQFNEQSLSLGVGDLRGGDSRAVFKNTRLDMNMYKRLQMFIHTQNENNENDIAGAFIRLGTDTQNNYYQIEIPKLKVTQNGSRDQSEIWPEENEIDIPLDELRNVKLERNRNSTQISVPYSKTVAVRGFVSGTDQQREITRTYKITVVGNPDLSSVQTIMLGVKNADTTNKNIGKSFTVWMNELRANDFDDQSGEAGILSADIKLADFATIMLNGNFKTYGFGAVQDRISLRSRDESFGYGFATNVEVDKLLPQNWGLSIPFFGNFDKQIIKPHFDPLNPDIVLEAALNNLSSDAERDRYRKMVVDQSITRGFNFSNVRKVKTNTGGKSHFYDLENLSFTYAQNRIERSNILIDQYISTQNRAAMSYLFQPKGFMWEPFKKSKSLDRPLFYWLKDFNLSPVPNMIQFRTDYNRSFTKTQFRNSDLNTQGISPNIIKYYLTNRYYDLQWNLTKSVIFSYNAQMNSIIDDFGQDPVSFGEGFKTLGRAKNYVQKMQATYRLPLDKIFILDWMQADARYNNNYGFTAGSFNLQDENGVLFGNLLENGRELGVQGRIDLVKLYNKVKYLKFANSPNAPKARFTRAPGDDEEVVVSQNNIAKSFTRVLMTVRGINFNWSRVETTLLPGFLLSPQYFGLDFRSTQVAPGLPFVLGNQNRDIHKTAAANGWLSESIIQNNPFTQTRGTKFDYSTSLEPFKGFRMQIRGNLMRADSYQELYRPDKTGGSFTSMNPLRNGSFSMSFWSFKTAFKKIQNDSLSSYKYEIFDNMVANRDKVIEKLNAIEGIEKGYDKNSQDVLIPAFFAAYSGTTVDKLYAKAQKKNKDSKTFNPFLGFPLPNWRIDYAGLEKYPLFNRFFNSITLSHSYSSSYSVGNFTSSLLYDAETINLSRRGYSLGNKIDESMGGGLVPVFIMSTISMEEKFLPVIGVQFTTKRNFTGRIDYNRERKAILNLSNAQVAELMSYDIVFGVGFRKNNVKLPMRGRDGNFIILKNDLNFRLDFTVKDLKEIQRKLDGDATPIRGNYYFQLRPQVQYQVNRRLSMSFYIEWLNNTPFTTISNQTSSTIGGINARFNLSD